MAFVSPPGADHNQLLRPADREVHLSQATPLHPHVCRQCHNRRCVVSISGKLGNGFCF